MTGSGVDRAAAIVVRGLSKRYRIGGGGRGYTTLRETLAERFGRRSGGHDPQREIWALDDVSFEVEPGEAIGVIGANGAGKTTLLKVLSRVTEPTRGEARIRGRVGALLEVGTGFHPELTGRENVYLNGAILGMSRAEITSKFDEIVSFADLARFVDTPVKRYSSGMYLRLAFAVAAHLDTDVLLVDETLSVGDYGFQQRCLRKMQEQTSEEGRTVLFVSHQIGAVKSLTEKCIWLDHGRLQEFGPTDDVFRAYLDSYRDQSEHARGFRDLSDLTKGRPPKSFPHDLTLESVQVLDESGQPADTFVEGDRIGVFVRFRAQRRFDPTLLEVMCRVWTLEGVLVFTALSGKREAEFEPGLYETSVRLDPNPLAEGNYSIELVLATLSAWSSDQTQDRVPGAITFAIEANPTLHDLRHTSQIDLGVVRVGFPWSPLDRVAEPAAVGH